MEKEAKKEKQARLEEKNEDGEDERGPQKIAKERCQQTR